MSAFNLRTMSFRKQGAGGEEKVIELSQGSGGKRGKRAESVGFLAREQQQQLKAEFTSGIFGAGLIGTVVANQHILLSLQTHYDPIG